MPLSRNARRGIGLAAFLLSFHTLLAYGLAPGVFLVLVVALAIVFYRAGYLGAVTTSLALLAVTLLYALTIKLTGFESAMYYRPHEQLATYDYRYNHRVYRPNARIEMRMPYGDLQSMTKAAIAQPREVVFQTDSDGFRNDRDYHGQRYALVGDSFIAAVGDSQEAMLNVQLERDYGVASYNLGQPGNLNDYLAYIRGFRERYGEKPAILLFLFEGNDFPEALPDPSKKKYGKFGLFWKRYYNLFSDTGMFRLTKSLYKRLSKLDEIERSENVRIFKIRDQTVAFYAPYIEVTKQADYRPDASVERTIVATGARHIFFIPTKYRVYHNHLEPGTRLPDAYWEYLNGVCNKHQLNCTNLTAPLTAAADQLLKTDQLVWWSDDTHWNAHGMAVAARVVAARLKEKTMPKSL